MLKRELTAALYRNLILCTEWPAGRIERRICIKEREKKRSNDGSLIKAFLSLSRRCYHTKKYTIKITTCYKSTKPFSLNLHGRIRRHCLLIQTINLFASATICKVHPPTVIVVYLKMVNLVERKNSLLEPRTFNNFLMSSDNGQSLKIDKCTFHLLPC